MSSVGKSSILKDHPKAQHLAVYRANGEFGLTKREELAARAMQGIATNWLEDNKWNPEAIAARAVDCADWLLVKLADEE